jgi:hypothetical protein
LTTHIIERGDTLKKSIAFLFVILLLTPAAGGGQELLVEAVTVPVSMNRVTLSLVLHDGQSLRMTILEGGLGRIHSKSQGLTVGLSPRLIDPSTGVIELTTFEIVEKVPGYETISQRESFRVDNTPSRPEWSQRVSPGISNPVAKTAFAASIVREMRLEGISLEAAPASETGRAASLEPTADVEADNVCSRCCVDCGDNRACGCAVEMECGSCCCDPCCGLG